MLNCFNGISVNANLISVRLKSKRQRNNFLFTWYFDAVSRCRFQPYRSNIRTVNIQMLNRYFSSNSTRESEHPRKFDSANIFLFKINNRNTRKRCEIWSKLTIKTPERPSFKLFLSLRQTVEYGKLSECIVNRAMVADMPQILNSIYKI